MYESTSNESDLRESEERSCEIVGTCHGCLDIHIGCFCIQEVSLEYAKYASQVGFAELKKTADN